jgi:hypothetical protein
MLKNDPVNPADPVKKISSLTNHWFYFRGGFIIRPMLISGRNRAHE